MDDIQAAIDDDIAPVKRIRYVFTVVLPPVTLIDDPMAQRVWLAEQVGKLEATHAGARVGVLAVINGD